MNIQGDLSTDLWISLCADVSSLVFCPINSWLPWIPSSVLNLGRPLGSADFHTWATFWNLSWGIKLGQFYDSLWLFTISQGSLFFVSRLSMSCSLLFQIFVWFCSCFKKQHEFILCCSILAGSRIPHALLFV